MRPRGVEPRPIRWQRTILAAILRTRVRRQWVLIHPLTSSWLGREVVGSDTLWCSHNTNKCRQVEAVQRFVIPNQLSPVVLATHPLPMPPAATLLVTVGMPDVTDNGCWCQPWLTVVASSTGVVWLLSSPAFRSTCCAPQPQPCCSP